jgi:hypothetical protein
MKRTRRDSPGWSGVSPGGFSVSGSWNNHGAPDTPVMLLVKELVRIRHSTESSPAELVSAIPTPLLGAFPNHEQWATIEKPHWWLAQCSTSAESAVVYCFRSPTGEARDSPSPSQENLPLAIGQ